MQLVIDTSVLMFCHDQTNMARHGNAFELLNRVLRSQTLVLDHENQIEAEYHKQALQRETYVFFWWEQMLLRSGKIERATGKLDAVHQGIAARSGFDPDDYPFLAVAKAAACCVVHEDSDYEKNEIKQIGVTAARIAAALGFVAA